MHDAGAPVADGSNYRLAVVVHWCQLLRHKLSQPLRQLTLGLPDAGHKAEDESRQRGKRAKPLHALFDEVDQFEPHRRDDVVGCQDKGVGPSGQHAGIHGKCDE
jgi:hypothetical protein